MLCLGGLTVLWLSFLHETADPTRDAERQQFLSCVAAEKCGVAPPGTKCISMKPKKDEQQNWR